MIGTTILGYRIEEKLGEGGMGAVFKGVNDDLGQQVAIKVLAPELARIPEVRERFLQEARIQIALKHPGIVPVLTADTTSPQPVLVMELVEGLSLADVVKRRGPLPVGETVALMEKVLDAVGYAHGSGIIHRDLKPANIMVQANGAVKVMDFGIARVVGDAKLTRTGTTMGTADYMAPEQILGKPVDARADLYSLGCVLFETLTGKTPFAHVSGTTDSDFVVKQAHVQAEAPDPRNLRPELPAALVATIARALAKSPERRFESAAAMKQALQSPAQPAAPAGVQAGAAPPVAPPSAPSAPTVAAVAAPSPPPAPTTPASTNQGTNTGITDYAQVPWFRKNGFVILTWIFCWPVALVILWTGNVYYLRNGELKTYGAVQKVLLNFFAIFLTFQIVNSWRGDEGMLAASATPLVTQIIRNAAGADGPECKGVEIVKKVSDDFYKAKATLSTGEDIDITIERRGSDQIFVQITEPVGADVPAEPEKQLDTARPSTDAAADTFDLDAAIEQYRLAYTAGNYDKAIDLLKEVERRNPNEPRYKGQLALSYAKAGDPANCRKYFEAFKAVSSDPSKVEWFRDLLARNGVNVP